MPSWPVQRLGGSSSTLCTLCVRRFDQEAWQRGRMGLTANELSVLKRTGGSNPLASATQLKTSARSSTDRASDYGSEGWGFESLRARPEVFTFHLALSSRLPLTFVSAGAEIGVLPGDDLLLAVPG